MALVLASKPNSQGDTRVQRPTTRFNHSSHTAKAASAAIASAATTMPAIVAFSAAVVPPNPKIQGDRNRKAPRIRLATSQYLAFVQFAIHTLHRRCPPDSTEQSWNAFQDSTMKLFDATIG